MKLSNKNLIDFLNKEFLNIAVKFDILQVKRKYKNRFYRGYIYINNFSDLSEDQIQYINDKIYPILIKNNWENLTIFSENKTKEEIIKEHFPIIENI